MKEKSALWLVLAHLERALQAVGFCLRARFVVTYRTRFTKRRTVVTRCHTDSGEHVRLELPSIYTEAFFWQKRANKMRFV